MQEQVFLLLQNYLFKVELSIEWQKFRKWTFYLEKCLKKA